jgi:hypothetical protein
MKRFVPRLAMHSQSDDYHKTGRCADCGNHNPPKPHNSQIVVTWLCKQPIVAGRIFTKFAAKQADVRHLGTNNKEINKMKKTKTRPRLCMMSRLKSIGLGYVLGYSLSLILYIGLRFGLALVSAMVLVLVLVLVPILVLVVVVIVVVVVVLAVCHTLSYYFHTNNM